MPETVEGDMLADTCSRDELGDLMVEDVRRQGSVTECPDFEETVDACCNKCEQHNGQIQPSPYIGVGVSWNFLQFQVLLMKIIRP